MSVFKRRGAAAGSAAPAGTRAAPFSSPAPLLSTGISALDDIMCGGGVLSGSLVLFVPFANTAAASVAQLGAPSSASGASDGMASMQVAAADAYTELFLAYVLAQGLASQHVSAVAGEAADTFVNHLMGEADAGAPSSQTERKSGPQEAAESMGKLNIAWRYDKLQRLESPFTGEGDAGTASGAFCSTFDLSKRISEQKVKQARDSGSLFTVDLSQPATLIGQSASERAWGAIEQAVTQCRAQATDSAPQPVLRIVIRGFGSPAWGAAESPSRDAELVRFLLRLRALVRQLSLPEAGGSTIPCIAAISLSSYVLMSRGMNGAQQNVLHRMSHLCDGCIGLSSFAASPELRTAFPDYTGALRVFRTPAIGTLSNPSLRASVLRGMGAGTYPTPSTGAGARSEGGAGGGENNLAFKVKRKRLAIETLHLDIEGGVSERRTKPVKEPVSSDRPTRPVDAATSEQEALSEADPGGAQTGKDTQAPAARAPDVSQTAARSTATGGSSASRSATEPGTGRQQMPVFGGLAHLRQRGLASMAPVEIERDTGELRGRQPRERPEGRPGNVNVQHTQPPRFSSDRPQDYEF